MPIFVNETEVLFLCNTRNSSYAFTVDEQGNPFHLWWGARLDRMEDLPTAKECTWRELDHYNSRSRLLRREFPVYGNPGGLNCEPCLKLRTPDCAAQVKYTAYRRIGEEHLVIDLADAETGMQIALHYELYPELDLIARHAEIVNAGTAPVKLEAFLSAAWHLPRNRNWRLTTLQGEWGQEYRVRRTPMEWGKKELESRNGVSGHQAIPFFAVDEGNATERDGEIRFGTLLWSGDWKISINSGALGESCISGGLNDFDFELPLAPGERFQSPVFLGGWTRGGFGEMTRRIHRYSQTYLYPESMKNKVMPVVFNTYSCIRREQVTEENVLKLIPQAAAVGCELFIIDAGWQLNMGDWRIHPEKFPGGFAKIIEQVKKHGMKFGLWVEFERVDSMSSVYREHPDWRLDRNGYSLLNFARREVMEYVCGVLRKLLTENEIVYLKMDLNRYFEVPDPADRRELRTRYMLNFYEMCERLSREFPNVFMENCASGSGRGDLEMDRYFARINRSDNQDTRDILEMEEGFTYLHLPKMAGGGCQISKSYSFFFNQRVIPLRFMAHMAMMGWPSLGIKLFESSPEELAECKRYLDYNCKIRHIVAFGELHRLANLREDGYAAFEFVLPDASEALLFMFAHGLGFAGQLPDIRLEALSPDAVYTVEESEPRTFGDFCRIPEIPFRPPFRTGAVTDRFSGKHARRF